MYSSLLNNLLVAFFPLILHCQLSALNKVSLIVDDSLLNNNTNKETIITLYDFSFSNMLQNFSITSGDNKQKLKVEAVGNSEISYFLNIGDINGCTDYTEEQLTIKNCTLNLKFQNQMNSEIIQLNFINAKYSNSSIEENYLEYQISEKDFPEIKDLYTYPVYLSRNISFEECADSLCKNSINQTDINDYYFKISENSTNYNIFVNRAFIIVRKNNDKIAYIADITSKTTLNNDIYTISMEILPNNFDLYLICEVRFKPGIDGNSTNPNYNNWKFIIFKKNIKTPYTFSFNNNPNQKYLWITLALIAAIILTTLFVFLLRFVIISIKLKNTKND